MELIASFMPWVGSANRLANNSNNKNENTVSLVSILIADCEKFGPVSSTTCMLNCLYIILQDVYIEFYYS